MKPVALPITSWGMEEGERGGITMVSTQRHSDGAEVSRPEHGALSRREYDLLATEGPAGDPAVAGSQRTGDDPKENTGTRDTVRTDTITG